MGRSGGFRGIILDESITGNCAPINPTVASLQSILDPSLMGHTNKRGGFPHDFWKCSELDFNLSFDVAHID